MLRDIACGEEKEKNQKPENMYMSFIEDVYGGGSFHHPLHIVSAYRQVGMEFKAGIFCYLSYRAETAV